MTTNHTIPADAWGVFVPGLALDFRLSCQFHRMLVHVSLLGPEISLQFQEGLFEKLLGEGRHNMLCSGSKGHRQKWVFRQMKNLSYVERNLPLYASFLLRVLRCSSLSRPPPKVFSVLCLEKLSDCNVTVIGAGPHGLSCPCLATRLSGN